MSDVSPLSLFSLIAASLSLLVPLGVAFLAREALWQREVGLMAMLAYLLALVGMAATGFALYFGGIGILIDHPDLSALVWEWTPVSQGDLAYWGAAGWMGFGMNGAETALASLLFLTALAPITVSVFLAMLTFWRRFSAFAGVVMATWTALMLAPLVGNWTQGGGWLMHLGESLGAGNGFLDEAGASFFLLPTGMALAMLFLPKRTSSEKSEDHGGWGAILVLVGGIGWVVASPLHLWLEISPAQAVLNVLLSAAAGGFIGLVYSWFVWREPSAIWGGRGVTAGFVASLAGISWMHSLQAMLVGAVATWICILSFYFIHDRWGRDDDGLFSAFGLPALWGILAVGLFAPAPGQTRAQFIGALVVFFMGFLAAVLFQIGIAFFSLIRRERPQQAGQAPPSSPALQDDFGGGDGE